MTIDVGGPINAPGDAITVGGVTLAEFRQRLRIQLSSYAPGTLISNSNPDIEAQFINDGIGQLWPWDFQVVNRSMLITAATQRFVLPIDCEHVFSVAHSNKDINEPRVTLSPIPHYDGWTFDSAFVDSSTAVLEDGAAWTDTVQKVLNVELRQIGSTTSTTQQPSTRYLVVRYARRWQSLLLETDAVDPSSNRVQAIIHFAAAAWFNSQFQVNSESIRIRNYQDLTKLELQIANAQLVRDPKYLFTV